MTGTAQHNRPAALIAACRPAQWVKNAFVLAPLVFGEKLSELTLVWRALGAVGCFCLVSSAAYVVNDLSDRQEDLRHPVKRLRPIASGAIGTRAALALAVILGAAGLAGAAVLDRRFLLVLAIFAVLNVAYSLGLKHVVIVDVMVIAAGFVLRILGGSAAIGVQASHWLVLCTILISFFLGFTKRRAEIVANHPSPATGTRPVLQHYSTAFLDQAIAMVTGATIVCYALYTVDERTLALFGSRALLLTVPSVMYGMFRYVYLIYHVKQGEDPTGVVLRDVPMIVNLAVWIVVVLLAIHYGARWQLFLR